MDLNTTALRKAIRAYKEAPGGTEDGVVAAIKTYLTADLLKPGQVTELPLEAIPQRDYRKEVWIAAITTGNGAPWADQVLAHFDKTFPQEKPHG